MNLKILPLVILLVLWGSVFSHAQKTQTIEASDVSLTAFPGERAESATIVRNRLFQPVTVYAASAIGELRDRVKLDNTFVEVASDGEENLPVRVSVLPEVAPGVYAGRIVLTTGNVNTSVAAVLTVRDPWDELELSIAASPFASAVIPGEALNLQVDVQNILKRKTDLVLVTRLIDLESKTVILEKEKNFTVTTEETVVESLLPEKTIERKAYVVRTAVYSPKDASRLEPLAEDSFEVDIGVSPLMVVQLFLSKLLTFSNVQVFFGLVPAALFIVLAYWRYRLIADRRRRYLGMVSFDYLPRPGKRSEYLGRVAESTKEAYLELDVLQTHTLCAGATGSGKTVAAQVIVEEALLKKVAVIVFDPTGQWTGFLRPCSSRGMLRLYPMFNLKRSDARAFSGNIHVVESESERVDVRKYMNPGEITIFSLHKLSPKDIDSFLERSVRDVFASQLSESAECRLLMVYDEVHRMLPKFGGSGRALVQIERGVREFRKWGVGLVLVSQVLSDFVGEIKANIGTEIQMRTRYEMDLDRIRLKYGIDIMRSIVKASVGTGMIQNAEYNQGRSYFITIRPLLHDPHRLSDEMLELFGKYNRRLDELWARVDTLSAAGVDVFDITLELNLALENIRKTAFDVVELYAQGLEERVSKLERKLASKTLAEDEKKLVSVWDTSALKEVSEFKGIVETEALKRRDVLLSLEEELKTRLEVEIKGLELRRAEIKRLLAEKIGPAEKKKLLREHEEVVAKEQALEERLLADMEDLVGEITRSEGMLWRITGDRKALEERGETLTTREEEVRRRIERDVTSIVDDIVKRRRELISEEERASLVGKAMNSFKKYLMKRAWEEKQLEKRRREEGLVSELTERKGRVYQRGRTGRIDLVKRKDLLLEELKEAKAKWMKILDNERLIREKEAAIIQKRDTLRQLITSERTHILSEQARITEERKNILASLSRKELVPGAKIPGKEELLQEIEFKEKTIDQDFKHLEEEWDRVDRWLEESKKLDEELKNLRTQWEAQEDLRLQEEEEIMSTRDELASLRQDVKKMLEGDQRKGGSDD